MSISRVSGLIVASCLLSFSFFSSSMASGKWFNQASFGFGYTSVGENKNIRLKNPTTLPVSDGLVNAYTADGDHRDAFYVSYASGFSFDLQNNIELFLGAEGSYINYGVSNGINKNFVNYGPNYDKVGYRYETQSYMLSTYTKLLFTSANWRPFLAGGIGIACNYMNGYDEFHLDGSSAAPTASPFGDHSQSSFAYNLGVGLSKSINDRTSIDIGYKYVNTGRGSLGTSPTQDTEEKLGSGSLNAHLLVLSVCF